MPDPPQTEPTSQFPSGPAATSTPGWYPALLASVSDHVTIGHRRAVAAANAELLASYWSVGREILDRLFADLKNRFPEARGYSPCNLKYMRAFAAAWPDSKVVQCSLHNCPGTTTSRCWRSSTPLSRGNGTQRQRWRAAGPPLSPTPLPDELASSLPSINEIEAELATTLHDGAY